MSVREDPIYPAPSPVGRVVIAPPRPVRERRTHASRRPRWRAQTDSAAAVPPSPTTSIHKVLITLIIGLLLGSLFGARGIVHSGEGMEDGPARAVTLKIGHTLLPVAETLHLTWPWDRAEEALGRQSQPAVPPLLATRTMPTTSPAKSPSQMHPVVRFIGPPIPRWPASPAAINGPPRRITKGDPLRLLVTGDSLVGFLGPELVNEMSAIAPVHGFTDTHNGTGLTRPDFVDWSVVARQQVASDNPDAVVVMIGGNDFQNMTLGTRVFIAGTPSWTREYQRRAEIVMRTWAQGGNHRVYWLSMPPARDPSWAYDDAHINIALQRAAHNVPGARFVNVLGPITNHGHYSDFVSYQGQPTLIREPDGVHLNLVGSTIVAHQLVPILRKDWRLR
jgi:hypothetical protein